MSGQRASKLRPPREARWSSLTVASSRPLITPILIEIAELIWASRGHLNPGLASGLAGCSIYLASIARYLKDEVWATRAQIILNEASLRCGEIPNPGLYSGFTGIAWTIEIVEEILKIKSSEDLNEEVDDILIELLKKDTWLQGYDLISGLVGIGVYALQRFPKGNSDQILAHIVRHLEVLSTKDKDGIAWITEPRQLPPWQLKSAPMGYYNLGVAHGIPGVIAILSEIHSKGIETNMIGDMLTLAGRWLRANAQEGMWSSVLPYWKVVNPSNPARDGGRVAWCYGDLGSSVVFRNSLQLTPSHDLVNLSEMMASKISGRDVESAGIMDACLCHGSAGNFYAFKKLQKITGNKSYGAISLKYLDHIQEFYNSIDSCPGFPMYFPAINDEGERIEGKEMYKNEIGFLEGSTGVGLALLSHLDQNPCEWDRALLLSSRSS